MAACAWLLGASAPAAAQDAGIPEALRDWVGWVLADADDRACPMLVSADGETPRACAWPGELALEAGPEGARFTQRWTVHARTAVPLPGDGSHWPQAVRSNGVETPVVPDEAQRPVAWLDPGEHALEGRFKWAERPESLALPGAIALVRLSVDGVPIAPLQRDDATLWFGRAASVDAGADALAIEVYRRLDDGVPATLTTRIVLNVSGEGREVTLGRVLPEGFAPTSLTGGLPAKLDGDGALVVQVRPGSHLLVLAARAQAPLDAVARPAIAAPWPVDEVWSYADDARLRVTSATTARAIDPAQAGVPGDWAQLPAFLLAAGESLALEERSRGMSPQDQNRLVLERQMWLRFDGTGFDARDRVHGTMLRDWRLDVAMPYVLERAAERGEGLLVTRGASAALSGVEVRSRAVDVAAGVRVEAVQGALPIAGWQQSFDAVTTTLSLPPACRLFAALGADHAPDSWLARWNLLDVFLVALTTLLAAWLAGRTVAGFVLVYLVLAYHEPGAPVLSVLVLVVVALLAQLLPAAGRLARVLRWARNAALVVLVLLALAFVAAQVRLALYPQLERGTTDDPGTYRDQAIAGNVATEAPPMAQDAAAPPPAQEAVVMDRMSAVEKRSASSTDRAQIATQRLKERYAANTILQAGSGDPSWRWNVYTLHWSGPVLAGQTVRLLISPPWFTRVLRVVVVLLLAGLLAQLARNAFGRPLRPGPGAAVSLLAAALMLPLGAHAQGAPSPELLQELETRLLEAPRCAPRCGHIADADVSAQGDTVAVALSVHAVERVAVPIPAEEGALEPREVTIDGSAGARVLRHGAGQHFVVVPRGVHRVEIAYAASNAGKFALRFPLQPSQLDFAGDGWEAEGIADGRLLTDTLGLVRIRTGEGTADGEEGAQQFAPYVRVVRTISLGIDWEVTTEVVRVAPDAAAFSVRIPLLPGEQVLTQDVEIEDRMLTAALQAGALSTSWHSRLARAPAIELVAPELSRRAEAWFVHANPTWNVAFAGVPPVHPQGDEWIHEFHPLPGEKLLVTVTRPEALAGASIAIDRASLSAQVGKRAVEHTLELSLRTTQGGQHVVTIPAGAEVLEVSIDGAMLNVRPEAGRLSLPIRPGTQRARVRWREARDIGVVARTAAVGLGARASNLELAIGLPADRWVLRTNGPRVGPAVLYWGELVVLVLVAVGLARLRRAPLKLHEWLLLGIGFSTFSWLALLVVVAWLVALDARCRTDGSRNDLSFNLGQLGLAVLTVLALVAVVSAIPAGLLGTPDMHLVGNASTPTALRWFHDRSADAMPLAQAWSLPMWVYKAAMLAWALWLSSALVRWLKWGWSCWSRGGHWRTRRAAQPASDATPSAVELPAAASPAPQPEGR